LPSQGEEKSKRARSVRTTPGYTDNNTYPAYGNLITGLPYLQTGLLFIVYFKQRIVCVFFSGNCSSSNLPCILLGTNIEKDKMSRFGPDKNKSRVHLHPKAIPSTAFSNMVPTALYAHLINVLGLTGSGRQVQQQQRTLVFLRLYPCSEPPSF
jgi:hypothetical protein